MAQAFQTLLIGVMLTSILAACGAAPTDTETASAPAAGASAAASLAATAAPTEMAAAAASPMTEASTAATTNPAATRATETTRTRVAAVELPEVDAASVTGDVVSSGSSTVFPLVQRMAERFKDEGYAGTVSVDEVGSGAGFQRFCESGETDIANASRPIKQEETEACGKLTPPRTPIEFRVGTDALAIVVSAENDFVDGLTLEQLSQIYTGEAKQWSDVDPSYPAEAIALYSPGTDSGTYDYFVEAVLGKDKAKVAALQQQNPTQSENDNVLVQGVESSPNAIGYFGYAYYQENKSRLKLLTIDGIEASEETAENGEYPLSRPLFIYSDAGIMKSKPQVAAFINFFLTNVNDEIIDVGYFPASAEALNQAKQNWRDAQQ